VLSEHVLDQVKILLSSIILHQIMHTVSCVVRLSFSLFLVHFHSTRSCPWKIKQSSINLRQPKHAVCYCTIIQKQQTIEIPQTSIIIAVKLTLLIWAFAFQQAGISSGPVRSHNIVGAHHAFLVSALKKMVSSQMSSGVAVVSAFETDCILISISHVSMWPNSTHVACHE
jgi:hypothetical protein